MRTDALSLDTGVRPYNRYSSCWFYNGRSERASLQRVSRLAGSTTDALSLDTGERPYKGLLVWVGVVCHIDLIDLGWVMWVRKGEIGYT